MGELPDIANTRSEVRFAEIVEFDQLDERVSAVTTIFGSVIGVNEGYVEWCPDDDPPSEQERLAWIWLCNPSLDREILPLAEKSFRDLLVAYRAGEMPRWWEDAGSEVDGE